MIGRHDRHPIKPMCSQVTCRIEKTSVFRSRFPILATINKRSFFPGAGHVSPMNKHLAVLLSAAFASTLYAQVPPEKAESTFTVHDPELEWKLWASEPLFANPTSMDI
jgi:hypothetical protein